MTADKRCFNVSSCQIHVFHVYLMFVCFLGLNLLFLLFFSITDCRTVQWLNVEHAANNALHFYIEFVFSSALPHNDLYFFKYCLFSLYNRLTDSLTVWHTMKADGWIPISDIFGSSQQLDNFDKNKTRSNYWHGSPVAEVFLQINIA